MRKRLFSALLALCIVLALLPVTAWAVPYSVTGGNIYFDAATGTITGCDASVTEANIPSEISGVPVTQIGMRAFYECRSLTSVTIPNSVTSIGSEAFGTCTRLTSVTIPNSVTSIGAYAFSLCYSLTNLIIPNSVTEIGDYTFYASHLTSVTIPNSVTSIGASAFQQCDRLTSVTIPNSVTSIGSHAFWMCKSLSSINVTNGNSAYSSVDGVLFNAEQTVLHIYPAGKSSNSYDIPVSVTSIGYSAFNHCDNLTSVTIPNSVTSIGVSAFESCNGLTSMTIPNSVTSIGGHAFYRCSNLTSVTISNSVTTIGRGTFNECSSLTNVTIPKSVTSIGENAFRYCNNLTDVYYAGSEEDWSVINIGIYNECLTNATIHYNSTGPNSGETSISLDKSSIKLTDIGAIETLIATVRPADAVVTWSTSDDTVATVDNGVVTAVGVGSAIISASISNGNTVFSSMCTVTVVSADYKMQDELLAKYIEEHINYYQTSYIADIVSMRSTQGLGFMLDDLREDDSYEFYKGLTIAIANMDMISSMINPFSYIDVKLAGEKIISLKIPDEVLISDLGNSEYSVILYQLMASDTVYNGILDTFSMDYEKNIRSVAKKLTDNAQKLVKEQNREKLNDISAILGKAVDAMSANDFNSSEFNEAYENYQNAINQYLDLRETKDFLENSKIVDDAFSISGAVFNEINTIGKAYQYACWAKTYAETDEIFKTVLTEIANRAKERYQLLYLRDPLGEGDIFTPYSEASKCLGLSKAIDSFIEKMDKYAEDSFKAFNDEVLNAVGDNCLELIGKKPAKELGKLVCPSLGKVNAVLKTGKLLTDLFTEVDDEYKAALAVESLELISDFLRDISKSSGELLLADKIFDASQLFGSEESNSGDSKPDLSFVPTEPDSETRFTFALRFDESIKMYKNAMLLACDYATMYEESKLAYASKMADDLVSDWWYDIGGTTSWQRQASESSLAISLLSFQKSQISDIHCHEDGLAYNSSTGQFEYNTVVRVICIACPVNVTVLDPDGKRLAYLTNGSIEVASGYEPYFFIKLLDADKSDYAKVIVVPHGEDYQVLIDGIDDGTMSVFVGKYDGNSVTEIETFANFHVTNETTGYLDSGDDDNTLGYLVLGDEVYGDQTRPSTPYTITVTASPAEGGSVTATPTSAVAGETVTLTVEVAEGYALESLTATDTRGKTVELLEGNTFKMPASNVTVSAVFRKTPLETYTITYDSNGGAGTMANGTATKGQPFTLPSNGFTAPSGQRFKAWLIGTTEYQPGDKYTFTASTTVKAIWENITMKPETTYTVTVNASPAEGGSVTGGGTYNEGTSITVKAVANSGYRFVRWTENGTTLNTNTTYEFIAEANRTLTAVFERIGDGSGYTPSNPSYQITVLTTSNGTITVTPTSAKSGAKVTITATPNSSYQVGSVTVRDASGNALAVTSLGNNQYSFTMPSRKVTVDVTFVPIQAFWTNPFIDVSEGDWFYDGVAYVAQHGLMQGAGGGKFNPSGTTTRGMITTILYRLEGEPAVSKSTFTDVAAGQYYTNAVAWAAANKIVEGYGNNAFGPNDDITREQLATMLWRYAGKPATNRSSLEAFPDATEIHDWAIDGMAWAAENEIIIGSDDKLKPQGNALRSQAAVMLKRFCENIEK